ncbi:unnamed protein product [Ceratitis capitata]|uniref:(Mediterranean fruit fly) hypothetical protein n=1 Tax=Ceratitis capitata TaxID=7213 RepID=A0A811U6B7_CERCA|nr:unnamed protein product [Ceratitis capitata]
MTQFAYHCTRTITLILLRFNCSTAEHAPLWLRLLCGKRKLTSWQVCYGNSSMFVFNFVNCNNLVNQHYYEYPPASSYDCCSEFVTYWVFDVVILKNRVKKLQIYGCSIA